MFRRRGVWATSALWDWRIFLGAGAVCVSLWQGVQALTLGAVGVPGIATASIVVAAEEPPARKTARYPFLNVTTVVKTHHIAPAESYSYETVDPLVTAALSRPAHEAFLSRDEASRQPMIFKLSARQDDPADLPGDNAAGDAAGDAAAAAAPEREAMALPERKPDPPANSTPRSRAAETPRSADARAPAAPRSQPSASAPEERTRVAALPPQAGIGAATAPTQQQLGSWVKSQAHEFVGGVDSRGMPLYRFDVWLDVPAAQRQRIVAVDYSFDAPSATPEARSSRDRDSGFRVDFGGASCARIVRVAVTLDDGNRQQTRVNGCAILN